MAPGPLSIGMHSEKPERSFSKTRVYAVIAALFFLSIILLAEFSPLTGLLSGNEITRSGVEKYRVHIMAPPELTKVASKLTTVNQTVKLDRLAGTSIFRLDGGQGYYSYRKLNSQFELEELASQKDRDTIIEGAFYSLGADSKNSNNKPAILLNDRRLRSLDLSDSENSARLYVLNGNRSGLVTTGSGKSFKVFYIADLKKSAPKRIDFKDEIRAIYYDENATRVYAKTSSARDDSSTAINTSVYNQSLKYIDPAQSWEIKSLDIPVQQDAQVAYLSKGEALCVLDREKLRVFGADDGQVREIIYLKDHFKTRKGDKEDSLVALPMVPAVLLNDILIDVRDGSIVDTLPGFTDESLFAVDYGNKNLYYSPASKNMEITIYDLHNLALKTSIRLGTKNSDGVDRKEREDTLKYLFMLENGYLMGLSAKTSTS